MSQHRSATLRRLARPHADPIRLDLLDHPYGPSVAVFEALSDDRGWSRSVRPLLDALREGLAAMLDVPPGWVLPANGIDELLDAIYLWRRDKGPLVLFPPTDPAMARRAIMHRIPVISLQRTAAFAVDIDLETAADLPPDSWAIVESPNDPTGSLLDPLDAVRLARASDLLVIDERHGAYAGRSLLPLVREFENIVLLQTMETWAGLRSFPLAYAVAPPRLLAEIAGCRVRDDVAPGSAIAALATIRDLAQVQLTVRRVRLERSRLYRMLRKLNMVSPCPSWANFLPVRVERGSAGQIANGLAERGILVHKPPQHELGRLLRVSAGLPEHTDALKQALVEIGREL